MQFIDKAKDWWRERREKAAEAKASRVHAADQLHGHSRFWLLNIPVMATLCAAVVEWYWAILFCIEATGHIDWNWATGFGSSERPSNAWNFSFEAHIPVLLGLLAATAPIVMLSMVWLPVQFAMRGAGRWRRGSIIAVGILANILVIVSGTVVMNYNRQAQVRDALVVEQTAQQGVAGLQAQRASIEQRRDALIAPSNTTLQAQAARAGVAGWDAYIETARRQAQDGTITPQRLALIERARGSAVAVEDYQRRIDELTGRIASAPTQAAVAANVADNVGSGLNTFAQQVEVWRPPFIALICTLIGIFGTWWVIAMLEHMNPRDVLRSGWAPEELRIEDKRDEPPGEVQPMTPPRKRRKVYNPETGKEEVFVQPKGYWRSTGKKVRNADGTVGELMEVTPEAQPDETGVEYDGGGRVGSIPNDADVEAAGAQGEEREAKEKQGREHGFGDSGQSDRGEDSSAGENDNHADDRNSEDPAQQDHHSDTSEELPVFDEPELAAEPPVDEHDANADSSDSSEPDADSEHVTRSEPETREDRLIAAE